MGMRNGKTKEIVVDQLPSGYAGKVFVKPDGFAASGLAPGGSLHNLGTHDDMERACGAVRKWAHETKKSPG